MGINKILSFLGTEEFIHPKGFHPILSPIFDPLLHTKRLSTNLLRLEHSTTSTGADDTYDSSSNRSTRKEKGPTSFVSYNFTYVSR